MHILEFLQQSSHEHKLLVLQGSFYATFISILAFCKPIPQNVAYHNFADKRRVCCVANFGDVVSNIPFLFSGGYGIFVVYQLSEDRFLTKGERLSWFILFVGIFLVGFGSGYYHLKPNNARLFWVRTPMCVSFAGLNLALVEVLGLYKPSPGWQFAVLLYCLWSCYYWRLYDDLRFYRITQFYPLAVSIPILLTFQPKCNCLGYVYFAYGAYVLAKLTEKTDWRIFQLTNGIVSGHTVKHLAAAAGIYSLVIFLQDRRLFTH